MLMAVMAFSLSAWSGNSSPKSEERKASTVATKSLVTKSMSDKIADACLRNEGYTLTVFYRANEKQLTTSDIIAGKGREILMNLNKHPQYAENFIREIVRIWGYKGLKSLGFTENEINISKKIVANP